MDKIILIAKFAKHVQSSNFSLLTFASEARRKSHAKA